MNTDLLHSESVLTAHTDLRNQSIPVETLRDLYSKLVYPRLVEEKMLNLLRQGQISKWFSGIGQEAISVGVAAALEPDEIIFTMHRNLGVFTTREVPLTNLFCQWQGTLGGYSKGRERSFHFGTMAHHIVGMISHLGPQLSLAAGVALAHKLKKEAKISVAFTGEGGTSQGEFHEALNLASVWKLPVIFLVENNGYGLSTPVNEQYACERLSDRGKGYGMRAYTIDGNNILEVYETISRLAVEMRQNPEPVLLECMTFRMRGHEEASGTKYVPKELMDYWAQYDPIKRYEDFLRSSGVMADDEFQVIRSEMKHQISTAIEEGLKFPKVTPSTDEELLDVYADAATTETLPGEESSELRYINAISQGLDEAMLRHNNLILMGQDIAEYGGVFKITEGLVEKYGRERVRNTTLCESAVIGASLGLSLKGFKSMVEMQFADFVTCGFNQIVNNLAKIHYRWGQPADVVIRMPSGGGVGAGPFHSQSNEAWFTHIPGLKVVFPSNPYDAKGLLLAAIDDPNPVMYFEHKALYRAISGPVPTGYYTVPIGKAVTTHEGHSMSIITYGMGVHWAMKAVKENPDISIEVIDLRTLLPLDIGTIVNSVKKTGRALILHEDTMTGGIGGEIAALVSEHCFEFLDAPVMRCAGLDTPIPFAIELEKNFMPDARLQETILKLVAY